MKFNIEVDTTPEEVRRLIGLPDLSEVHEVYLEKMKAVAEKGLTPDMVQGMIRNWVPMGDQSMDMIKGLMGGLDERRSGRAKTRNKPLFMDNADTIFALSSGAPPAAIASIRISGPDALAAATCMAGPLPPAAPRFAASAARCRWGVA